MLGKANGFVTGIAVEMQMQIPIDIAAASGFAKRVFKHAGAVVYLMYDPFFFKGL